MDTREEDPFAPQADNANETSMVEHGDDVLYGSDTLPATFQIDGETVALGTIVAAAFEKSGLTEDEWNALPADERDAKLHTELDARGADAPEGRDSTGVTQADDREVLASDAALAPTHDTEHDQGLSDKDARVPGDAAPLASGSKIVDAPKDPLGSLPDTAKSTSIVSEPLAINTDVSDRADDPKGLSDAVIPTKPGGADEQDVLDDETKQVASKAPKREAIGLVNDLDLHWSEFKHKVSMVTGDLDGEIGEAIDFARKFL